MSTKAKKSTKKAAPKAKANGAVKARTFAPDAKIHLLVRENPKRPKTAEFKRFSLYKNGMSVQAAKEAGMSNLNLTIDVAKKYITVGA